MKKVLTAILMALSMSAAAQEWVKLPLDSVTPYCYMFVTMKVSGHEIKHAMLDTGAGLTLLPYKMYAKMKADGTLAKAKFIQNTSVRSPYASKNKAAVYEFSEISVGGITLHNVWIMFNLEKNTSDYCLVGQNIFRKLGKLYIDWGTNTVYVSPSRK